MTLRTDYILHFAISALIMAVLGKWIPALIAVLITLVIGICKELVWDKAMKKGTPEWWDILADIMGIALGVFICL